MWVGNDLTTEMRAARDRVAAERYLLVLAMSRREVNKGAERARSRLAGIAVDLHLEIAGQMCRQMRGEKKKRRCREVFTDEGLERILQKLNYR